jgi:peptide/nickel transport system permease protein
MTLSERASSLVLGLLIAAGIVAPWLGYDPVADVAPLAAHLPPSGAHWLGTDHLGRDVAWRLLLASHAFVVPGLTACAIAAAIGVPAGAYAGYRGGWVASVFRFGIGVIGAIPRFVLVLLAMSIYGNSSAVLAVTAGVSFAPVVGEALYARIEELRTAEYVEANRAHGIPEWRILWVHLVIAAAGRRIVRQLLALFGYFIALETTLSYIGGFGVAEPFPSWGNMITFEWGRDAPSIWPIGAPILALLACIGVTTRVAEAIGRDPHE